MSFFFHFLAEICNLEFCVFRRFFVDLSYFLGYYWSRWAYGLAELVFVGVDYFGVGVFGFEEPVVYAAVKLIADVNPGLGDDGHFFYLRDWFHFSYCFIVEFVYELGWVFWVARSKIVRPYNYIIEGVRISIGYDKFSAIFNPIFWALR